MSKEEMLSEGELSTAAGGAHVVGPNGNSEMTCITPTDEGEYLEIWDGTDLVESYEAGIDKKSNNLVFYNTRGRTAPKVAIPPHLQYKIFGPKYQV